MDKRNVYNVINTVINILESSQYHSKSARLKQKSTSSISDGVKQDYWNGMWWFTACAKVGYHHIGIRVKLHIYMQCVVIVN
jgi:hypothetical protein